MKSIWGVASVLALITGALSIIALVRHILRSDFVRPLSLVLDYYHSFLQAILGWADAPLGAAVAKIGSTANVNMQLYADWKYVFVLMWLYFSSDAKINWYQARKLFALCSSILGLILAVAFSAFNNIGSAGARLLSSYDLLPIFGIFLFIFTRTLWVVLFKLSTPSLNPVGMSRLEILRYCIMNYDAPLIATGVISSALLYNLRSGGLLKSYQEFPSAGLLLFLVATAVWKICRGIRLAVFDRGPTEGMITRFWRSGSARLGARLLAIIIGAIVFFALNAGLKEWGL